MLISPFSIGIDLNGFSPFQREKRSGLCPKPQQGTEFPAPSVSLCGGL